MKLSPWARRSLLDFAQLFALCGLAFAQPLLDLLGKNPTFFVAHDVDGSTLVWFTLAVIFLPPLLFFAVLMLVRLAGEPAARVVRAGMIGLLLGITVVSALDGVAGWAAASWILALVGAGLGFAFAYDRFQGLRTFVTYLAFAPVLFAVLFLFFSASGELVSASDPSQVAGVSGTRTPVIVLVLDEIPLGALLDTSGDIDAVRYPNFARLADLSTWYPKAETVATWTELAVPAIMTGKLPIDNPLPTAADHPQSIFTLLADSHDVLAYEPITRVCPDSICTDDERSSEGRDDFLNDLKIVALHETLPTAVAEDWLPPINDRWTGFGETAAPVNEIPEAAPDRQDLVDAAYAALESDQSARFLEFLASISPRDEPTLWFHHSLVSHRPAEWLPDGRVYDNGDRVPGLVDFATGYWPEEPGPAELGTQRFVLQLKYADLLVGALLDRLEATDMLDRSFLAVTADHGAVYVPGQSIRPVDLTAKNEDGILPIPMFVKFPGQDAGAVSDLPARTTDVLPTVVDALGIDLPKGWSFDGRSLSKPADPTRAARVALIDGPVVTLEGTRDPLVLTRQIEALLGRSGGTRDGYRLGPHGGLVGELAAPLVDGSAIGSATTDRAGFNSPWSWYNDVDLKGAVVPALFTADVTGIDRGRWVAVALNGTIAGVGPVVDWGDQLVAAAMLDPALLKDGRNAVDLYLVDASGSLRPIATDR